MPIVDKIYVNDGLFLKKADAAIADKEFAMKLLKERCLECSICAIFFSSSLTVSIKTLLILFCYTHQRVLHVAFNLCNKLNTVHKEIIKQVFQMFADILLIIMLEASEAIEMKQDNLNVAQAVGLITMPDLLVFNHIFFLSQRKFLAKIIGHTINLCNFKL